MFLTPWFCSMFQSKFGRGGAAFCRGAGRSRTRRKALARNASECTTVCADCVAPMAIEVLEERTVLAATLPSLTINSIVVTEGNAGTTTATFTVKLSAATTNDVTFNYSTVDVTANATSDYIGITSGSGTITKGTTSTTINLSIIGDTINEATETFQVVLSGQTNAKLGTAIGVCTIKDNDPLPKITIDNPSVNGDNIDGSITFTVKLDKASGQDVSVKYSTASGTATAGSDYTAQSGTVTILKNSTSQTVTILVTADSTYEANETLFVNLSGAVNGTIATSRGTGTIKNDDDAPLFSISGPNLSVSEGAGVATFTVTKSGPTALPATVTFKTGDPSDTAKVGADYTAQSGKLTFAPNETSKTVSIKIIDDKLDESDEVFSVLLLSATSATIGTGVASATIVDNDAPPSVTINDVVVTEGKSAVFTVKLSAPSGQDITVEYETVGSGTATSGDDFSGTSGTLLFKAGEISKTITVSTADDALDEAAETFFVNLVSGTNVDLGAKTSGTGTITDNDPTPSLTIADVTVNEEAGTVTFAVTLSAPSGQDVYVNYITKNGTAIAGVDADYIATSGTLHFNPGDTTPEVTLTVAINNDTADEKDETFFVALSSFVNASISKSQAVGTIVDNDDPPTVSIDSPTGNLEGTGTNSTATFTVTLSTASGLPVSVSYATVADTAGTKDFVAKSGLLTFAPGETSKSIVVTVIGDALNETDETFNLVLSNPVNAAIDTGTGTATIVNDDDLPTVSINDVTLVEGNSGTRLATFTVSLSAPSGQLVTLGYSTGDDEDTATSLGDFADYVATQGSLSFAPGETKKTIIVTVNSDTRYEDDETLSMVLTEIENAANNSATGTATILNDDAVPKVSIDDVEVVEGNSGDEVYAVFTVSLSAPSGKTVTVIYSFVNGTATQGFIEDDYGYPDSFDNSTETGTVTIEAGQTSAQIKVPITSDDVFEPDANFFIHLDSAVGATIQRAQGKGTIVNDDSNVVVELN